jgi:hypothetical protein
MSMGEGINKVPDEGLRKPTPPEGHESSGSDVGKDNPEEIPEEKKAPKWMEKYQDEPFTLDQMTRFPSSYKMGPLQAARYNLGKDSVLQELNQLLAKMEPEEAPMIVIEDVSKNFSETIGDYVVLVFYRKVMYKHPKND